MSKAIADARAILIARREALCSELAEIDRAIEAIPPSRHDNRRRGKGSIGPRPQDGTLGRIRAYLFANPGSSAAKIAIALGKDRTNVAAMLSADLKRDRVKRIRDHGGVFRWALVTPDELLLRANLLDPKWPARLENARRHYRNAERDAAEYAKTAENAGAAE
jgi:hypothetical protein